MTKQQQMSLAYPCRLAVECVHPRYASLRPGYSVVLTVNTGYE